MAFIGSVLLFVGGAAAFIGYVWIVVLGFRVSPAKGLSLIFFTRGLKRFAAEYPQSTRVPMILMIGGGALLFGGGFLASKGPEPEYYAEEYDEEGGGEYGDGMADLEAGNGRAVAAPVGRPGAGASPGAAAGAAGQQPGGSAYVAPTHGSIASASDVESLAAAEGRTAYLPAPSSPALPRSFRASDNRRKKEVKALPKHVGADQASQLLTHNVKVVKKSGNYFKGRLATVDGEKVIIRQSFGGGTMEIAVLLDDIERIERVD